MEFKERFKQTFGDRLPKNPQLSAITKRIILPVQEYVDLQKDFTFDAYNMWCAGINKGVDPNSDHLIPVQNYIESGDAKSFSELFITEHHAELEAKQATTQEEK
ncbi:MAG: hypothetical protein UT12_C0027G0004 [Candidatus Curtissbacteria bacterium GW2011_GWC2_38_9]|uniref:Uncharacterized protein n=1 Tax=Candidatus Curtissbacteria bacterium GW2011_GWC2_38_9 TaxID=1618414 RepID=A0A0G0NQK0_9BACT|nr:MAG: hypothetical protein UT12_C0027G0004 [Candidatus Curtissbacteria bacterium GW2011_GWC2_38_9]